MNSVDEVWKTLDTEQKDAMYILLGTALSSSKPLTPEKDALSPRKVIFSGPATVVIFEDGEKIVSKCHESDVGNYSRATGLHICYLKKLCKETGLSFTKLYRYFSAPCAEVYIQEPEPKEPEGLWSKVDAVYSGVDGLDLEEIHDILRNIGGF